MHLADSPEKVGGRPCAAHSLVILPAMALTSAPAMAACAFEEEFAVGEQPLLAPIGVDARPADGAAV